MRGICTFTFHNCPRRFDLRSRNFAGTRIMRPPGSAGRRGGEGRGGLSALESSLSFSLLFLLFSTWVPSSLSPLSSLSLSLSCAVEEEQLEREREREREREKRKKWGGRRGEKLSVRFRSAHRQVAFLSLSLSRAYIVSHSNPLKEWWERVRHLVSSLSLCVSVSLRTLSRTSPAHALKAFLKAEKLSSGGGEGGRREEGRHHLLLMTLKEGKKGDGNGRRTNMAFRPPPPPPLPPPPPPPPF